MECCHGRAGGEGESSGVSHVQKELKKGYTDFDPSWRKVQVISEKAMKLLSIPAPGYLDIYADVLIIRDRTLSADSVRVFCIDNKLDEENSGDVSFAGICVALVAAGALNANTADPTPVPALPAAKKDSLISPLKIHMWQTNARRMIEAAFAYASQGSKDGDLPWYESYSRVYGPFLRRKRFIQLCEAIVASGFLYKFSKSLTVGEVMSFNDVIKNRLTRLSTPNLIVKSLLMVKNETIYRMIDPDVLSEYVMFQRAGILAQIASGPLKVYCQGNIDVLKISEISSEVTISELKAIEAPYDSRLIRQAYMILSAYNDVPAKWYQGKKAMIDADSRDYFFQEVVKAYKATEKKVVTGLVKADTRLDEKDVLGEVEVYEEPRAL